MITAWTIKAAADGQPRSALSQVRPCSVRGPGHLVEAFPHTLEGRREFYRVACEAGLREEVEAKMGPYLSEVQRAAH